MEVLRSYNLAFSYEKASSIVLHSRFPGITFGYRQLNPPNINQLHNFFALYAQEFNPQEPDPFLVYVIHTLAVQERVVSNLSDAAPGIQDPLLLGPRIPQFRAGIQGLHQQFAKRRPDLQERLEQYAQQRAMGSNQTQASHATQTPVKKGKKRSGR
jgi:hypothetical protein